jgi:UDP-2-acetamido-3-amino-2,3-dideoxy-glucuronate N-acetyltransferase
VPFQAAFSSMPIKAYFKHPKALVDAGARIGKDTRIWAFAHVMTGARIGDRCNIGNYVFVESGASLGNQVTVKNGVQIWEGVQADDGVFIGPGCVFTNHLYPRAFLKMPKSEWLVTTRLQKGCTLGASSTILAGKTVGTYAFVAAAAVVVDNVPDFALVAGAPARFRSWRCVCARPLRFNQRRARCMSCNSNFEMSKNKKSIRLLSKKVRDI